jgi:hypothetical protein
VQGVCQCSLLTLMPYGMHISSTHVPPPHPPALRVRVAQGPYVAVFFVSFIPTTSHLDSRPPQQLRQAPMAQAAAPAPTPVDIFWCLLALLVLPETALHIRSQTERQLRQLELGV